MIKAMKAYFSNTPKAWLDISAETLIFCLICVLPLMGCSGNDNDDAVNNTSNVEIEWVNPDPDEPVIKYEYTGGLLTTMIFYQKFEVRSGSGKLNIVARIEEGTGNNDLLEEQTFSGDVEYGTNYKIAVTANLGGWGSCSPTDNDLMIFESISAPTIREIYIAPTFDVDHNWWECAKSYSIIDIQIQQL